MKTFRFSLASWLTPSLALLLAPALPNTANACGGFWCSQSAPVNQASEQILFIDHPDDTVTTVIQIQYAGPAENFAWVIPMPGVPTVEVSSNIALARLNGATAPQYNLEPVIEGQCYSNPFGATGGLQRGADPAAMSADLAEEAPPPAVSIEAEGATGPYEWTVISLREGVADPADVATEWFIEHGYDLSGVDSDLLGPYLADGLNLLAFRLTKGQMTGSIRPVALTYASELPMIPLRPTAVAAQDDMPIQVWVAGETQSIPHNYKSLVINESLINWFNYRQNYNDVVTAAADQAGGQGFVTELAAPMEDYSELVFTSFDQQQWNTMMASSFADGIDAIWAANQRYRGWDGWREAIEASVVLPEGTNINDFARNPDGYRQTAQVDIQGFLTELYENVVKPVRDTQAMLNSRPYLTRMYSTMSADEMTVDPVFNFNSDLADVTNVHTAQQHIQCSPDVSIWEAPWRIELPQGGVILGEGSQNRVWPIELDAMPANLKIVQLSTSGPGEIVFDNRIDIGHGLFERAGTMGEGTAIPDPPTDGVMIGGDQVVMMMDDEVGDDDHTDGDGDDDDASAQGSSATNGASGSGADDGGTSGSDAGLCRVGRAGGQTGSGALVLALLGAASLFVRRRVA